MCAIVGAILEKPSQKDWETIQKVFLESSVRGLHATGVSFLLHWNKGITTFIEPVPANKFIQIHLNKSIDEFVNEDGNLYMIGHCRYSTSDLQYNQPLYSEKFSVVHNGVVSQEMPERWEELYGYKCKTRNDSELILKTLENARSPLDDFPNSSMAVVELYDDKKIRFYRNGKRPIYYSKLSNGYVITSTKDIALRSDLTETKAVSMNTYHTVTDNLKILKEKVVSSFPDLQYE
jgi:glutamine phosphoribosylpyrophosphate amidotransferase